MTAAKKINVRFFEDWTEESAYTMGLIFADGTLVQDKGHWRVRIGSNDYEILEKIKTAMESEHKITSYENHHSFGFGNPELIEVLTEYGLVPRKSNHGKFPKQIPAEFLPHFIRGYFDGDGHFTWEKHKGEKKRMVSGFTFGNPELAEGLVNVLHENYGLTKSKVHHRDRRGEGGGHGQHYECRYYARDTRKLYDVMYKDATMYIERKKAHYDNNQGT